MNAILLRERKRVMGSMGYVRIDKRCRPQIESSFVK